MTVVRRWWWWCVVVVVVVVVTAAAAEDTHTEQRNKTTNKEVEETWRRDEKEEERSKLEEEKKEEKERRILEEEEKEEEEEERRKLEEEEEEQEEEEEKSKLEEEEDEERSKLEETEREEKEEEEEEEGGKLEETEKEEKKKKEEEETQRKRQEEKDTNKLEEKKKEEEEEEEGRKSEKEEEDKKQRKRQEEEKDTSKLEKKKKEEEERETKGERIQIIEKKKEEEIEGKAEKMEEKKEEERKREMEGMEREEEEEEEEELPYLSFSREEIILVEGEWNSFDLFLSKEPQGCIHANITLSHPLGFVTPSNLTMCSPDPHSLTFTSTTHGTATLTALGGPSGWVRPKGASTKVSVMWSRGLTVAADTLGWLYTIAWDISFLPQIIHNWRRKSVIGLSFDFLTFNFVGFFSYFIFNMGLLWIPEMKKQYCHRYPDTILHVRLNDVIFPLYALVCTTLQIAQCLVYRREVGQRVSWTCWLVSGALVAVVAVGCLLVPLLESWLWLDVLYLFSYIKLVITSIKYVPQLWVNYKSQSTQGWSIYQVMLDFTGGSLSLVQMFLLSANYDDWESMLTDPAKLGLGLLSILFNILFFIQHYCLYRHSPSEERELKGIDSPFDALKD